ncbi:MAG TPA: phosphatase PAP2 family protein [Candidatus Saccharimonadales bacterium]
MSIDTSLVRSLNTWGEHHRFLVRISSNDLVYAVILLAILWFFNKILKTHPLKSDWKGFLTTLLTKGLFIFGIPVGIATLISELISKLYVRQRPFVAVPNVQLLVPHGADGGMPSHHIVFMVALIVSVYFYQRRLATFLALLTVLTGIARVAAGIHYPSDVLVGAVLGAGIAYLYRWGLVKLIDPRKLLLVSATTYNH